ncbi:MAG: hypothetical protein M3552_16825 [Planctomycetota bacterium]|nr:hypothetical protein [Planctomycetota bacterium]
MLAKADQVAVTGGATVTTRSSLWQSLIDSFGGFGALVRRFSELLLWPLNAAWEVLHDYVGKIPGPDSGRFVSE